MKTLLLLLILMTTCSPSEREIQNTDTLLSCFKPARQSSNYMVPNSNRIPYPASNAFDCRNQPLHLANFSYTGLEATPWIEVDLLDTFRITQIDVINRIDNVVAKNRLKRFRIFVSLTPLTELPLSGEVASYNQPTPALDSIKYAVSVNGRYVRLWMEGSAANYLGLSELRVWGSFATIVCDTIKIPIAFRDSIICN